MMLVVTSAAALVSDISQYWLIFIHSVYVIRKDFKIFIWLAYLFWVVDASA